jgi:hypothetical protein
MFSKCLRNRPCASLALLVLLAPGCAKKSPQQQTDKAEKLIERFLDAWSRGEPADTFAAPDQPIQGTDPDWQAGYRLTSFLSVESSPSQEGPDHFRCRVTLSLRDRKGREADKSVVYDVQLGDHSVIRRASP